MVWCASRSRYVHFVSGQQYFSRRLCTVAPCNECKAIADVRGLDGAAREVFAIIVKDVEVKWFLNEPFAV